MLRRHSGKNSERAFGSRHHNGSNEIADPDQKVSPVRTGEAWKATARARLEYGISESTYPEKVSVDGSERRPAKRGECTSEPRTRRKKSSDDE
jgi:hypothetical protein